MSVERAAPRGAPASAPPAAGGLFGRAPAGPIGMPVQKAKNFKGTLVRLLGYLRPHRTALVVVIAAGVFGTVFSVVAPKLVGVATTTIFDGYLARVQGVPGARIDFAALARILRALVALYLVSATFQYLQQYLMAGVAQRTVYALRKDIEAKFERLPLKFYDARPRGEILSRAVNDMDSIGATLQQNLTQFITSVLAILGVVAMMLTISVVLTLVIVLTVPLSLALVRTVAKRSQKHFVQQQQALGRLNGHVAEMFGGHTIVTAFGRQRQSIAAFDAVNDQYFNAAWRAQFATGMLLPIMGFVGNLSYVFVAVIGGILAAWRSITVGDVQAFVLYTRQLSLPTSQLSTMVNSLQLTIASAERVFELLDEEEAAPDAPAAVVLSRPRGEVQFDRVSFRYKADVPLIEDLNVSVASGQTVAIVGPTGAGKTTLVNLLMRFYDVGGGSIRVDGRDIRDLTSGGLRRLFGMVLQDTWLFAGTIRDNIAYGRDGAGHEAIVEAARAAQADHFIRTLPANYDTVVNEAASNLSQGQKQLLTIARAFLADPAMLILDEATSSVDSRTEILIQQAMRELMHGRTTFVIAHRLSTIRRADLILMLDHGRIVERGTHDVLLATRGRYAELYHSQFARA